MEGNAPSFRLYQQSAIADKCDGLHFVMPLVGLYSVTFQLEKPTTLFVGNP